MSEGRPTDAAGNPLPWLPYPAILWLDGVLRGDENVFEYGAGHSTLWLAGRVARVDSVESDRDWYEHVRALCPDNVRVRQQDTDVGYVSAIESGGPYDVVLIDGWAQLRPECLRIALKHSTPSALLVLDNSERTVTHEVLLTLGLPRFDLHGLAPGGTSYQCTTLLMRDPERWLHPRRAPVSFGATLRDWSDHQPLVSGSSSARTGLSVDGSVCL